MKSICLECEEEFEPIEFGIELCEKCNEEAVQEETDITSDLQRSQG